MSEDSSSNVLPFHEEPRSLYEKVDEIERRVKEVDDKINNLLTGLNKFLEFTESMKGHPLLAAFAPQGSKKR